MCFRAEWVICPKCVAGSDIFAQVTYKRHKLACSQIAQRGSLCTGHVVETAQAELFESFSRISVKLKLKSSAEHPLLTWTRHPPPLPESRSNRWAWEGSHIVTKHDAAVIISTHEPADQYQLIRWTERWSARFTAGWDTLDLCTEGQYDVYSKPTVFHVIIQGRSQSFSQYVFFSISVGCEYSASFAD